MTVYQLTTPKLTKNVVTILERRYLKGDQQGKVIESPADMFRCVADAFARAIRNHQTSASPAEKVKNDHYLRGIS